MNPTSAQEIVDRTLATLVDGLPEEEAVSIMAAMFPQYNERQYQAALAGYIHANGRVFMERRHSV